MAHTRTLARLSLWTLTAGILLASACPALAQSADPSLLLRPHCILPDKNNCPVYDVADPQNLRTKEMKAGDILDIDIVLHTTHPGQISSVRSWLKYDPLVLEARSLDLTTALAQPLPGEQTIDQNAGLMKIGGGLDPQALAGDFSIARVTFRVLAATGDSTISFYGYKPEGGGETSIRGKAADKPSLLALEPSALIVAIQPAVGGQTSSSAASQPSVAAAQTSSSTPVNLGEHSAFGLLQIQSVQVTSKDTSVLLGWQPLRSSELAGYNVYYGTISGKYLQRRSLPATENSLVIRDLIANVQYFLAVRGYNTRNEETSFSQEVSVVVGKPETSTAPLVPGKTSEPLPAGNPIEKHGGKVVTGTTGTSSTVLLLIFVSAVIGTFFALRRQLSLPATHV